MPERLPQLTVGALVQSAKDTSDPLRAAIAATLASGRTVINVRSSMTRDEVVIQLKCKRKESGRWGLCTFAEADACYIDVPGANGGGYSIGTFYPNGQKAGMLFYNHGVDRGRVEAAKHVLLSAVGASTRDDELLPSNRCTRCGLELKRRDSILDLVGPECADKVRAYFSNHQAPGEQFFADVAPRAEEPDRRADRERDPRENAERRLEARDAQPWAAAPLPAAEPREAAPVVPEGLIELPAGADPRELLRGLGS
jgi:hypothetical protein